MSNKTEVWKKASEVYAEISELSPQQALAHVYGIENITQEVREAIITLINAGSQASQYYKDNISQGFNLGINNTQNFCVGQQLDEYELLEEIGHGGMSQVFKAQRMNTEQQTNVAIKVFAPKDNSNELLNHFLNEQKILAGLSHPNIVKMLHSGQTDDNVTYLVMELIEGAQSLDSYCENNNLNTKQKIKYIAQCAHALAYSHANLIIHRDLKPDNILINQNGELKIVDFGIAKLINNDLSGNKTTIMALTPSYAAPEQINSEAISIKTDIFSLAVVALDLLTKEDPLPKDRLIKSCANDEHHIDALFKRLKIDKDLKNILNKALEQEPDKRYSSMQSFADDLNNYLTSNPVNATAQSFIYRIQKFAKRRSALFATLVSFIVFMVIGSILGYKQYQQIKTEAKKAQVVKQFMLDSFEVTDPDKALGVDISSKDLLKVASDKLNKNNKLDNETKFELLQTLGLAYGKLGSYKYATDLLDQSLKLKPNNLTSLTYLAQYLSYSDKTFRLDKILKKLNLNKLNNSNKYRIDTVRINQYINNSDFESAHTLLTQVEPKKINAHNQSKYISSKRLLAKIYQREGKLQKSIEILNALLSNKKLTPKITVLMGIKSDLAELYSKTGQILVAIDLWEAIIQDQKKILGNKHPELISSLKELSVSYANLGQSEEALQLNKQALDISIKLNGKNSLLTANVLNDKALVLRNIRKDDEAIKTMRMVISIYESQKPINYQDTNILKMNLVQLLNEVGKNQEAYELGKQTYDYQINHLGESHIDTIFSQQVLATILVDLNRTDEALILAKLAVKNSQKFIDKGIKSSEYVKSFYTLAKIYQRNKQFKLAIDSFLKITNGKLLSPDSVNYAVLTASIAKLYEEINDFDNAQKYYLESIAKQIKFFSNTDPETLIEQINYANLLRNNNYPKQAKKQLNLVKTIVADNNITDDALLRRIETFYSP